MNTLPNPFELFNKKMEPEKEKEKETVIEGADGTATIEKANSYGKKALTGFTIAIVLFVCFVIMTIGYSFIDSIVISQIKTSIPTSTLRIGFATLAVVLWGAFVGFNMIFDPTQTLNIFRRSSLAYIAVIGTFFVLETPPGQYLIKKIGDRFGLMVLQFLPEFFLPEFGRLASAFEATCFGNTMNTHTFPLEYILPMIDLNNGLFNYYRLAAVNDTFLVDSDKCKNLFDKYMVTLNIGGVPNTLPQAKQNVSDLFKLCLYKYSIGHFIIVYISIVSATLGASIVF